jgi:AraC-like DNA-binding protein
MPHALPPPPQYREGIDTPGEHCMVAPVFLAAVLREAVRNQLEVGSLLRGLELDATDLDIPGMLISHKEAVTVIRRALRLMPASDLGLKLGKSATITERGILALGQLAAATLGDAISLSVQFPRSAGYLLRMEEEISPDGHTLVAAPFLDDMDLQRFLVDQTFAALVQLRRQATSANYVPTEVGFVYPKPENVRDYEAFFACPVRFGCARNTLKTPASWLDFRLPWANAMAYRVSTQLLKQDAARWSAMPTLGFTVERTIRRRLPAIAELWHIAEALNISERTLRRRLAQVGLSYRQLLDDCRKSRALELLTADSRSLHEVAFATGFSDVRAFSRAFKRWTGEPPSMHLQHL